MPTLPILKLGNPLLLQKCAAVDDVSAEFTRKIITDLDDTLSAFYKANGFGRAIAAPQLGYLSRIVVVCMRPDGFCGALINPVIVEESEERITIWDDCLCFPKLLVKVSRARTIKVEYLDGAGEKQILEAEGDLSELLQHEIDHLDGILAIHRAVKPDAFMVREEWLRQGRPTA